jgi:hypothetical protein
MTIIAASLPHPPAASCEARLDGSDPASVYSLHCWSHDVDEVVFGPEPIYKVCFECKHVYQTEEELREAYICNAPEMYKDMARRTKTEDIYFCAYCLHDFL